MNTILGILVLCEWLAVALGGAVTRGDYAEVRLFRAPAAYEVQTGVALNDAARKDRDVGYQLRGALHVRPVWADDRHAEYLLLFNLIKPKLYLRGKHINADFRPFDSIWDSYPDTEFYVHWKSGMIETAYLDSKEPVDVLNYKKSLISLFQFQIIDGEFNETDISGTCDVLYESISTDVFRKIKRSCIIPGTSTADASVVTARRATRYSLAAGALAGVAADELLVLGDAALGVKARAWSTLARAPAPPAAAGALPSRAAALQAVPDHLAPAALALADDGSGDDVDDDDDKMSLEEAVAAARAQLQAEEAGAGGGAAHARAALRLLPALRRARAPALTALLHADDSYPMLTGLCRMLGLAGTLAAHAAADSLLHLGARDALQPQALAYLAGLSAAAAPAADAARAAARLADEARDPRVGAAALLAAAAAAARLPDDALAVEMRDDITKSLARCKDDECRATRLQALGHLRRPELAALLLEHAEGAAHAPALAALQALRPLPHAALPPARRKRLERIVLTDGRPLEVRALALDLLVERSAARPLALAETAAALHAGPVELRRVLWQRLHALAERDARARDVLHALPTIMRGWDAQALQGTSSALSRGVGWRAGGWAARLDSLQVAAAGLLRRGRVALLADAPGNDTHPLLTVEVWTRGLEAVAGAGAPDPRLNERDAPGDAAAGLALSVGGAALPPVDLFTGQAELLGHVWAGTGSAPTPVLRALRPLPARAAALPLLAGARLRLRWDAALALALDAHAQVSLWSRSARAALELRGAGVAQARAALRTAWGTLSARAEAEAEPRLRIAADLDFYDVVTLCVRVRLDDYDDRRSSWLESSQGARALRVSRERNSTTLAPGRSLSLGRAGDAACRALTAADDD